MRKAKIAMTNTVYTLLSRSQNVSEDPCWESPIFTILRSRVSILRDAARGLFKRQSWTFSRSKQVRGELCRYNVQHTSQVGKRQPSRLLCIDPTNQQLLTRMEKVLLVQSTELHRWDIGCILNSAVLQLGISGIMMLLSKRMSGHIVSRIAISIG